MIHKIGPTICSISNILLAIPSILARLASLQYFKTSSKISIYSPT